jgi:hypothetical protein
MSPTRGFSRAIVLPSAFGLICGLALGGLRGLYLVGVAPASARRGRVLRAQDDVTTRYLSTGQSIATYFVQQ